MGIVGIGTSAGRQGKPDGFHHIFLGIGDDPLYFVQKGLIYLFKIIRFLKGNLLVLGIIEKFF